MIVSISFYCNHFIISNVSTLDYSQCLPGAATSTQSPSSSSSTPSSPSSSSPTSVPAPTQTSSNISPEWAAAYSKVDIAVRLRNISLICIYRHRLRLLNYLSQIRSTWEQVCTYLSTITHVTNNQNHRCTMDERSLCRKHASHFFDSWIQRPLFAGFAHRLLVKYDVLFF